jgi:hypothetical protein
MTMAAKKFIRMPSAACQLYSALHSAVLEAALAWNIGQFYLVQPISPKYFKKTFAALRLNLEFSFLSPLTIVLVSMGNFCILTRFSDQLNRNHGVLTREKRFP